MFADKQLGNYISNYRRVHYQYLFILESNLGCIKTHQTAINFICSRGVRAKRQVNQLRESGKPPGPMRAIESRYKIIITDNTAITACAARTTETKFENTDTSRLYNEIPM